MANSRRIEGPRHQAWRHLKRQRRKCDEEVQQFNLDLASIKQNNPACADLDIAPIVHDFPDLPPEPAYHT